MKKIPSLIAAVLITVGAFAQAPQTMNYQAVVRNNANALVTNSPIGVKVSLLQGTIDGSAVYVETHTEQTNENGLLTLEIGGGTIVSGNYINGIYWNEAYYIKTEIDPTGGSNYTISSTSALLSVPHANYAHGSGVSNSLWGPAWDFVGAYKESPIVQVQSYAMINYLSPNQVALHISYLAFGYYQTLYGTVAGNTITFPNDNWDGWYGTATKNGNALDLNMYLINDQGNPVLVSSALTKQ